jgi:hypothetical protein
MIKKQYKEVEYVAVKMTKLVVMSYDSIFSMCCLGGIFCYRSLLAIRRKKIGECKEEIGNLNGFEYMYLSDLKVSYFYWLSSISIKVISMGTTPFPSMARLTLPSMNKQKLDPKDSTYNSLECEAEKKDKG